jgi:hypothetical protein
MIPTAVTSPGAEFGVKTPPRRSPDSDEDQEEEPLVSGELHAARCGGKPSLARSWTTEPARARRAKSQPVGSVTLHAGKRDL